MAFAENELVLTFRMEVEPGVVTYTTQRGIESVSHASILNDSSFLTVVLLVELPSKRSVSESDDNGLGHILSDLSRHQAPDDDHRGVRMHLVLTLMVGPIPVKADIASEHLRPRDPFLGELHDPVVHGRKRPYGFLALFVDMDIGDEFVGLQVTDLDQEDVVPQLLPGQDKPRDHEGMRRHDTEAANPVLMTGQRG